MRDAYVQGQHREIVAGTDGSASAGESVRQAASVARATGATLHIVGAYDPAPRDAPQRTRGQVSAELPAGGAGDTHEATRALLERTAHELRAPGLRIWLHAVRADAPTAITSVAARVGADLIVVGNRPAGGSGPQRRPVCEQVQAHAPCPVLVAQTDAYWRPNLDPAPPADAATARLGQETKVLLIAVLAVFMAILDVTIVNVAFPSIERSFPHFQAANLSWILNAYNVVVAALLVPVGRLADRIGRRRVFFAGLGVFLGGSALCGGAPGPGFLIAARVIQGVGAATLIPTSFGLVLAEFPAERRAKATTVWAAAGAAAAAAGPSLGGVLVHVFDWRAAFFVNLVLALGLLGAPRILSESRDEESTEAPDLFGGALLALGIGAIAMGIVKAPDWGWGSGSVLACWAAGGGLLAWLLARSVRHPSPVLEPALLRHRMFGISGAAFFVFSMGMYALLLGNILFLTEVWHYSVLQAGFAVTPGPLVAAAAAAAAGHAIDRVGPRAIAVPGLLSFALACLLYADAGPVPHYLTHWLPVQVLSGAAIGLSIAGLQTAGVMDLPPNRLATGSSISSCFRQLGAVLGIAGLIATIGSPAPQAVVHAFQHAWTLMAISAATAAVIAAALPRRRPQEGDDPAPLRRRRESPRLAGFERREIMLHGHRLAYRTAGSGPVILLIHGLLQDSGTWRKLAPRLAETHTVIAPDLLGHGDSDRPLEVDYSASGHAWMLRDMLDALGHDHVSVVGHSLGGGIALAFAGHYPDRVDQLTLISAGGFGREVHPGLRAVAVPGSGLILRALASPVPRAAMVLAGRLLRRGGLRGPARVLTEIERVLDSVADAGGRYAFVRTVRSVIDAGGQTANVLDRLEHYGRFPTLLLWGTADHVIPCQHGVAASELIARSELVLLDGIGHLPHLSRPDFVATRISAFLTGAPGSRPITGPGAAAMSGAPATPAAPELATAS